MTTTRDYHAEAQWLTKLGRYGARTLCGVAVLALLFTMVNVQIFAAQGQGPDHFEWWIAWLLDPMASITLGAAVVARSILADYNRQERWLDITMWYSGICTWTMNIWVAANHGIPSGVVLHSVAPGLILLLAEAAPRVRKHFAAIRAELERDATAADEVQALDRLWDTPASPVAAFEQVPYPYPVVTPSVPTQEWDGDGQWVGTQPTPTVPVVTPEPSPPPVVPTVPAPDPEPPADPDPTPTSASFEDFGELLALAQQARADLEAAKKPSGRDALRAELATRGHPISERIARTLIRELRTDPTTLVPAGSPQ
jgi:hypothetical protein